MTLEPSQRLALEADEELLARIGRELDRSLPFAGREPPGRGSDERPVDAVRDRGGRHPVEEAIDL